MHLITKNLDFNFRFSIDEALMGVLNSFQNASQKDVLNQLDEVTLQSISHQFVVQSCSSFLYFFSLFDEECIDYSRSCPVLICNMCLGVFHHIPSFQVHIQTCCGPPSTKFQSKLDHAAMDLLARTIWKQVFLKAFRSIPANRVFCNNFIFTFTLAQFHFCYCQNYSQVWRSAAHRVGRSLAGLYAGWDAQLPGNFPSGGHGDCIA